MFSLEHLMYPRVGWVGKKKTKQAVEEANKELKDITGKFQNAIGFSKAETMKTLDKLKLLEQC